jgi:hypothetical protein
MGAMTPAVSILTMPFRASSAIPALLPQGIAENPTRRLGSRPPMPDSSTLSCARTAVSMFAVAQARLAQSVVGCP